MLRDLIVGFLIAGLVACAECACVAAEEGKGLGPNWPEFRGPTHQGVSPATGLPVTWSTTENVAWVCDIPGTSWSSPIVWNDHVFVTTATDDGASCKVIGISRQDGTIRWQREVFRQTPGHKEGRNSYATPTPATDGRYVYACFGDGSFAAVDFDGNVVWTNRDHPFYGQHGLGTSPILHDGLLIMARDGSSNGEDKKLGWQTPWDKSYVVAIDTKTGADRWVAHRGLSRISHGVPTIWLSESGEAQVLSEAGDVVQGFDAVSGKRLWSSEVLGEGKVPSTVAANGLVFTAGGWGGKETIKAFRLGGQGDLKETNLVWEQSKGMPKVPSMLALGSHLYAVTDGGVATCLDIETGDIVWQQRLGGNFSASPVSAEQRLYIVNDDGETFVLREGPEFKILARNKLNEKVQASPAIAYQHIFIRTESKLYCIADSAAQQ